MWKDLVEQTLLKYVRSQAADGQAFLGYYIQIKGVPESPKAIWQCVYQTLRWIVTKGAPKSQAEVVAFLATK